MPVTRFDIALRRPVANGYEELKGRLHASVDPAHAANRMITDLDKAPRNAAGRVEYSMDVSLLLPVDRAHANGALLVDVRSEERRAGKGWRTRLSGEPV